MMMTSSCTLALGGQFLAAAVLDYALLAEKNLMAASEFWQQLTDKVVAQQC